MSKKPFINHVANGMPTDRFARISPPMLSIRCHDVNITNSGTTISAEGSIFDSSSVAPAIRCPRVG